MTPCALPASTYATAVLPNFQPTRKPGAYSGYEIGLDLCPSVQGAIYQPRFRHYPPFENGSIGDLIVAASEEFDETESMTEWIRHQC